MIRSYEIDAAVIIRGRDCAQMQAICDLPEARGKPLAAFGLAMLRCVTIEDAGMLLTAAPLGEEAVNSVVAWLANIKIETTVSSRLTYSEGFRPWLN